ncbi:RsiW-degrading membrane proteinase PrsW (M82 family) [Allocatelliglobosispora scoriae]|uniref:RsiW-degrading membrane proteinase PrsW (M82 family) n=1 Tax=Allocatelliglobosispora scoriae TaxID=643052 RepID=A0A841BNE2_9ACTN|nr:PrsW family intramembrane metalloprotease [Allocatelliglobosispora scoriae]MBB5868806.1 RsiW-degrading membrane proteinase PrsW (M82 family) [Allocatelliglobosispora scoriae]
MTAVPVELLDDTRTAALRTSGWGRGFRFFQPRNLAFWVYAVLVGAGVLAWLTDITDEAGVYGPIIAVSTVVFAVYGAIFWWFTQRIDRYARQNPQLMVLAFLWGAFAATWTMAQPANEAALALWGKGFGQTFSANWAAGLTAPFTEELAKGSGLLLLIALAPRLIVTAFDGFILGAFLGLGFQILEDISYAMNSAAGAFGTDQLGSATLTIITRIVVGVAAHILYSAVFGAGLVYFLGRPAEPRRRGFGLALMLSAMVLHGVWDAQGALFRAGGLLTFAVWFALIAVALVLVVHVFNTTVPRERGFMRDVMAPEVARGVITDAELDALAGDRKARKAYRRAGANHRERSRARHVLDAANDLAAQLAAAGGAETPDVAFARQEVRRLRG